ncbi:MAG TPA: hypothetical protein VJJ83_02260 [Candidatus Babeliales bacterium]|nr:hypothetical protein [Candidatus Babeliales bacterium]
MPSNQANYSCYYQAQVLNGWLLASLLKSYEHLAFDRTLDVEQQIFEFFVPRDCEGEFLIFMQTMLDLGVIRNLVALPNRLMRQ